MRKSLVAFLVSAALLPVSAYAQDVSAVLDAGLGARTSAPVALADGGRGGGREWGGGQRGGRSGQSGGHGGSNDGGGWRSRSASQPAAQPAPAPAPQQQQQQPRADWGQRGGQRSDNPGWQSRGRGEGRVYRPETRQADGAGSGNGRRWNRGGDSMSTTSPGTTPPPVLRDATRNGSRQTDWDRNNNGRVDRNWDRNRNGVVDRQWDRNRDGQLDRRWDNNRDGRVDRRHNDNRRYDNRHSNNNWNRGWRNDRRYDWNSYRNQYRHYYQMPRYYNPYGYSYGYQRFGIGIYLEDLFFSSRYWVNDPWQYRLPTPGYGLRWVRYYDDVLLVDMESGYVVDVIHDFFW